MKLVVAGLMLLASREVGAEPPTITPPSVVLLLPAPRTLCKPDDAGAPTICRVIPPGRFLDEHSWSMLDAELRRAQDAETRLTAENTSLRSTADGWTPGWRTLAVTLASGFVGGLVAYHYAAR